MKLTITIDMDNAAFDGLGGWNLEAARILRVLAGRIEDNEDPGHPRDINGNTVGTVELEDA